MLKNARCLYQAPIGSFCVFCYDYFALGGYDMHSVTDLLILLAMEVWVLVICYTIVAIIPRKAYLSWKERWHDLASIEFLSLLAHAQQTVFFFKQIPPVWGWYEPLIFLHFALKCLLFAVFSLLAHIWPNQRKPREKHAGKKNWSRDHIWSNPAQPSPL